MRARNGDQLTQTGAESMLVNTPGGRIFPFQIRKRNWAAAGSSWPVGRGRDLNT